MEAEHRGSVNVLLQTALVFLLQSLYQLITADLPLVAFTEPNCPMKHFHPPLTEVLWSALAVPLLPLTWRRLQAPSQKLVPALKHAVSELWVAGLCITHCSYNCSKELPQSCHKQNITTSVPTAKWGDLGLHPSSADPNFHSACTCPFIPSVRIC